jgi:hypothetical protein
VDAGLGGADEGSRGEKSGLHVGQQASWAS